MGTLISKFVSHVVPGIIKPLHALWNEVIGFLFLVFAALSGYYVYAGVRKFHGEIEDLKGIIFPGLFALAMTYYGVSSFLKARKISRS